MKRLFTVRGILPCVVVIFGIFALTLAQYDSSESPMPDFVLADNETTKMEEKSNNSIHATSKDHKTVGPLGPETESGNTKEPESTKSRMGETGEPRTETEAIKEEKTGEPHTEKSSDSAYSEGGGDTEAAVEATTPASVMTTATPNKWANKETQLLDKLFNLPGYLPDARPVKDSSTALVVQLEFVIMFILDLEEKAQILTTYSWIIMNWYDQLRVWNPEDYANLTTVTVPAQNIWVPDIGMSNSADQLYGDILDPQKFKAVINASGYVSYKTSGTTVTSCLLDVTFFPFDVQACYIQLDSWAIPNDQLDIKMVPEVNTTSYRRNSQWDLFDTNTSEGEVRSYDYVQAKFYIRRKPTYYLITLILPCVIMTVLSVLVFLMPNEAGEKISLQVTILLSFSVFQFAISDNMPKTSDHTPYINVYVLTGMMLAALSLVVTVLIQRFHFVTSRKLPRWFQFIMFDFLDKVMCVRTRKQVNEDYENRRMRAEEEAKLQALMGPQVKSDTSRFGKVFSFFGLQSSPWSRTNGVNNPIFVEEDEKGNMALAHPAITVEPYDGDDTVSYGGERRPSRISMVSEGSHLRARANASRRASQVTQIIQDPLDPHPVTAGGIHDPFMEEFRQVGRVCDRLFFFIFTIMILFITVGMFILFGVNKGKRVEPIAF